MPKNGTHAQRDICFLFRDEYGDLTKLHTFKFEIISGENRLNDPNYVVQLYEYLDLLVEFAKEEAYEVVEVDVAQQHRYGLEDYYLKCADTLPFTPSDHFNGYRNWIYEYELDELHEIIALHLLEYERLMKVIAERRHER